MRGREVRYLARLMSERLISIRLMKSDANELDG